MPFLGYLERVDFWTQVSVAFVCVRTRKIFFSPNGLKVIPFDSSRRAESNDIILSPFREKKFFDRKFSKSKFLYLEIFSNSGQICDPPRAGRELI